MAVIVALVIGIWVGGRHGDLVPEPLRATLVGSNDQIVVNEALNDINDSYYRELPPGQLANTAIAGAVKKLNDRFSNYFTPAEYAKFQQAQASSFTGIGVTVDRSRS
ncbi:MAG: hypothetical protein NTZ58_01735 [Solirubrobacterales bacterium]|nr:hypothetical protein [Solirubrobacterales bacterium]